MSSAVKEAFGLVSSLDPQLACVGARGWGRWEEVCGSCAEYLVQGERGEGAKVMVWAVRVMSEVVEKCSDLQLGQHCLQWREALISALQHCGGAAVLGEVNRVVAALLCRAHRSPTAVRDFPSTHLAPILSSLLAFQSAGPSLQVAVLPSLATAHHLFPGACKPHRPALLSWSKDGLLSSDVLISRECARLLVVMHASAEQWTHLITGSLATLSSSLLHLCHTITQATPPSDKLNLDLPVSEPRRSSQLLRLVTAHSRLLCLSLLSPPPSPVTFSLSTIVGVVSFGLHVSSEQIVTVATDASLLLTVLPAVHSALLTILRSLITSSHSHLLPYTSTIDACLLHQLGNEGGVVWRGCVSGAVCAWVRVRGEGGMGDRFSAVVVRWLLRSCRSEDEAAARRGLQALGEVVKEGGATLQQHTAELIFQTVRSVLATCSSAGVTLAGVKLLRACLEYPSFSPLLSTAIRILQSHTHHSSAEVCETSRRGLSTCSLLLHPLGPPWNTLGPPWNTEEGRVGPLSAGRANFNTGSPSTNGDAATTSTIDASLGAPSNTGEANPHPSRPVDTDPGYPSTASGGSAPPQDPQLPDLSTGYKKRRRVEEDGAGGSETLAGECGPLMRNSRTEAEGASQMAGAREQSASQGDSEGGEGEMGEGEVCEGDSEGGEGEMGEGEVCEGDSEGGEGEMGEGDSGDSDVEDILTTFGDSGDSDVEDILMTFCSSPSGSTSNNSQ